MPTYSRQWQYSTSLPQLAWCAEPLVAVPVGPTTLPKIAQLLTKYLPYRPLLMVLQNVEMCASSAMLWVCMHLALMCDPVTTSHMLYLNSCLIQQLSYL